MTTRYSADGDIAILTLDRPSRLNAIEAELSAGFVDGVLKAGTEARALIVTGAGKAFCAGADLAAMQGDYDDGGPDLGGYLDRLFHPMVEALGSAPIPTVGAINGVAAGAGLGLALGCDLRVMAASAKLTSAFTAIGLIPDSGTTWLLPHHVGVSKALQMALTNERVGAEEAHRLGLCSEVAADGECLERALELARGLADLPTGALVATRQLIRSASASSFDEALAAERSKQAELGRSADHLEGVAAFLEKRAPDFRRNPQGRTR